MQKNNKQHDKLDERNVKIRLSKVHIDTHIDVHIVYVTSDIAESMYFSLCLQVLTISDLVLRRPGSECSKMANFSLEQRAHFPFEGL